MVGRYDSVDSGNSGQRKYLIKHNPNGIEIKFLSKYTINYLDVLLCEMLTMLSLLSKSDLAMDGQQQCQESVTAPSVSFSSQQQFSPQLSGDHRSVNISTTVSYLRVNTVIHLHLAMQSR